jgi:hypothetical protein
MLAKVTHDLTVRLDEENGQLLFFASRRTTSAKDSQKETIPFSVGILLNDLKGKNIADGERLIGSSVLGFFDHLTAGRLDLPKHYRED